MPRNVPANVALLQVLPLGAPDWITTGVMDLCWWIVWSDVCLTAGVSIVMAETSIPIVSDSPVETTSHVVECLKTCKPAGHGL